jgi:hypothetical protein
MPQTGRVRADENPTTAELPQKQKNLKKVQKEKRETTRSKHKENRKRRREGGTPLPLDKICEVT